RLRAACKAASAGPMPSVDRRGPSGDEQLRLLFRPLRHHLAARDDAKALWPQSNGLDWVSGIEHDQARPLSDPKAEVIEAHDLGIDAGYHVEALPHLCRRGHL